MNRKLMTSVVVSVLISAGLYYMIPMTVSGSLPEVVEIVTTKWNLEMCVIIGVSFGVLSFILSLSGKKPGKNEVEEKTQNIIYWNLSEEARKKADELQGDAKNQYLKETFNALPRPEQMKINDEIFDMKKDMQPSNYKTLKALACILVLGFTAYSAYGTFEAVKPVLDAREAYLNQPYEDVIDIDGIPTIVVKGNNRMKEKMNDFVKLVKAQPQFLLDNCRTIYVQNKKIKSPSSGKLVSGYASPNNMSIHLSLILTSSNESDNKYTLEFSNENLSHELSHLFDYANGYHNYSNSIEFKNMYNEAPNSITEYGATNVHEFFAEAGMMYIHEPEELKTKNKDVYHYFDALYGPYMK